MLHIVATTWLPVLLVGLREPTFNRLTLDTMNTPGIQLEGFIDAVNLEVHQMDLVVTMPHSCIDIPTILAGLNVRVIDDDDWDTSSKRRLKSRLAIRVRLFELASIPLVPMRLIEILVGAANHGVPELGRRVQLQQRSKCRLTRTWQPTQDHDQRDRRLWTKMPPKRVHERRNLVMRHLIEDGWGLHLGGCRVLDSK